MSEVYFQYDKKIYRNNLKCIRFNKYEVREEKKGKMFNVYRMYGHKLITSSSNWKKACKIAKMLDEAYEYGYNIGIMNNY